MSFHFREIFRARNATETVYMVTWDGSQGKMVVSVDFKKKILSGVCVCVY